MNPFSSQQQNQQPQQPHPGYPPPMPMGGGMPFEMYENTKYYRGGMMPYQQPQQQQQGLPLPGISMFGGKLYILPILIPLFWFGACSSAVQPPSQPINNIINVAPGGGR